jgi:hypothetical protein
MGVTLGERMHILGIGITRGERMHILGSQRDDSNVVNYAVDSFTS